MKERYYIADTETGRLYMGETEYIPWVLNAFTDDYRFALPFDDINVAKELCEGFYKTKTEFDGNTPLKVGRLSVVKVEFKAV